MTSEKSYWFCCSTKCPAKGILDSDGEFQMTHPAHNHKPDFEKIKRKEKLVELKKLALQRNVSGQELLDALNIKDDVKKNLGFIRTCRRRDRKRHSISTAAPLNAGLNYKMLPSRIPSKEMLFHSGCLFRQDSRNPRNEKCKYWRCRVKKCKARAKTDDFGNLTILKSLHNHSVEESEETLKYFPEMIKSESSVFQKQVSERVSESRAKKEKLKTFDWKVGKQAKRRKEEKFRPGRVSDSVAYDPNQVFCPSATDSETFSLEKLITETLAENYCVTPEFGDSINLLKSSENPR